jgi:hypothetical protein
VDAFGKWRVSQPTTLYDLKQITESGSAYFADTKVTGGGTDRYESGSASSLYTVTQTSGSRVVRQSKRIFVYQPGKSQQILMTGVFGTGVNGIIKNIGYLNDDEGMFFQQSGSSFGVVVRSKINAVKQETFYSQSNWNLDKLDGTGPSGNVLDITKAQIFTMDFEWLGVGRIRYGIVQKGVLTYVHEITHYNSLTRPYIRNINLPIRYEIATHVTTTTGSLLRSICATVISEGGTDDTGKRQAVISQNGTAVTSNVYGSVLRIRYNPTNSLCAQIIPEQIDLLVSPGNNSAFSGRWDLLVNPTIADSPNWRNASGSLITQVQTANISASAITGQGYVLATGYFAGNGGQDIGTNIRLDPFYSLGRKIDGTSDVLVLAVKQINNTYTIYPTLVVRELT